MGGRTLRNVEVERKREAETCCTQRAPALAFGQCRRTPTPSGTSANMIPHFRVPAAHLRSTPQRTRSK